MTNDESRVVLNFVIPSSFDIRASASTTDGRASFSLSRDIWHYADSLRCGSALARSFRGRIPRGQQLSSGCLSETGTAARRGRAESARRVRNRRDHSDITALRWPLRYRVLLPAICRREFLPLAQCRVLPGACKPKRHCLPRQFAEARHAIDSHSRTVAKRIEVVA